MSFRTTGRRAFTTDIFSKKSYSQFVQTIRPNNLIAYWPLHETTGTNADEVKNNYDGTYSGVSLNQSVFLNNSPVGQWASADYLNIYSAAFNTAMNKQEGSLSIWAKVSGVGVWADATTRYIIGLRADASNRIAIVKDATANRVTFNYAAGGTTEVITHATSSVDWLNIGFSWSDTNDQVIAYINGTQTGSIATGIGTWVGNLDSTLATIGAISTAGTNNYDGFLAECAIWNTPLTATEFNNLYDYIA